MTLRKFERNLDIEVSNYLGFCFSLFLKSMTLHVMKLSLLSEFIAKLENSPRDEIQ